MRGVQKSATNKHKSQLLPLLQLIQAFSQYWLDAFDVESNLNHYIAIRNQSNKLRTFTV